MVKLLKDAKTVWEEEGVDIQILDLWSDPAIKNLTGNAYIKYMADGNHPTKAGYLELWTPKFEAFLKRILPAVQPEPDIEIEPGQEDAQESDQDTVQQEDESLEEGLQEELPDALTP